MIDQALAEKIHQAALAHGYDGCGIVPVRSMDGYKKRLDERIRKIPESAAVYGFYDDFVHLERKYPWAKSVIVCTIWLGKYKYPQSLQGRYAKAFMLSPDTVPHSAAHQQKLAFERWMTAQGIRFAGGEQNLPVRILPLRYAAVAAGLGIFRKNNFFYGEKGSYYMLEGYLIDRECEYINSCHIRPCAEKCRECRKACPTRSLSAPFTMNPLLCISFLTTFGGGVVPHYLHEEDLGAWICGCDACQDACPHNRHDWSQGEDFQGLAEITELLEPDRIMAASDELLCEKVIPKTESHIPPQRVDVLRLCAARSISNAHKGAG